MRDIIKPQKESFFPKSWSHGLYFCYGGIVTKIHAMAKLIIIFWIL